MGFKSGADPAQEPITVEGTVSVNEPVTVDAVDLDVRNLSHTQDSVRVGDGTDLALVTAAGEVNVLATAQPGVDIGDVTVNNAAGAAAVNIQDGGNSITVDGTVAVSTLPALVAGTANIGDVDVATLPTSGGKTITYVSVNQAAAGTTALAGASVGNKHKVVGALLVMSLVGTLKFTDGVGDLTGPMDIATNGGFVLGGNMIPYFETGDTNRALNLVTTLGAARGVVALLTEP